jgi:hypothetical protein
MTSHFGRWTTSLKTWTCHACGAYIAAGERFVWFPWFPGRPADKFIACARCATEKGARE